jgi:HAD superfamily hydrolase (TIGR01450 family)
MAEACGKPESLLLGIKAVVLDLDGTIYLGNRLIEGVLDLLDLFESRSLMPFFFTNNSTKSRKQLFEKLAGMGIRLELKQVYGTAYATAVFVQERGLQRVFCIGRQGLRRELKEKGVVVCEDERLTEALIIGMDTKFDRAKLSKAIQVMKRGGTAIACNRDDSYPGENGEMLPGCGSIVAAIESESGKKVQYLVGKPDTFMLKLLTKDWNLNMNEILVVGDSYSSDIAMAHKSGSKSILISKKKYPDTVVMENIMQIRRFLIH